MTRHEPQDLNDRQLRDRAVAAARGDAPFDALVLNGQVFDAITGEIRQADIGLVGPLIASVHAPGLHSDAGEVIDATGLIAIPGLIDTHMHIESSMVTPQTYANAVLPRGVTSIVWDPHELGNVHGLAGVDWAIDATRDLDLRVIVLAPSCVPSAPGLELAGADFTPETLQTLLARPDIAGIAEVMNMQGVIEREPRMSGIVQAGLESGKPVFGHARSLQGAQLNAFMAAGVSTDHEITSADDLMHKLRAGLGIELRGSHDHLLPECVAALNELGHLPGSLTLCTDDVFPDDLFQAGGLDDVVRRLIRYGMPASWALRAATYNAAVRLSRPDLGLLAAGRRADLSLVDTLENLNCQRVICNGLTVALQGRCLNELETIDTQPLRSSVKVHPLTADDFRLRVDAETGGETETSSKTRTGSKAETGSETEAGSHACAEERIVTVRTIHQPRFTQHGSVTARVIDGVVEVPEGVTLMAVTHRHGLAEARPRLAYLTAWGQWRGAFASTVSHDSHNLTAFGGNEQDMAAACNAVIDMQGGMAVAIDGQLVATLALPLSGLISDAHLEPVSTQFMALRKAMDKVVDWQPPYLVFKACFGATLACNAGPHLTDRGIADHALGSASLPPILTPGMVATVTS